MVLLRGGLRRRNANVPFGWWCVAVVWVANEGNEIPRIRSLPGPTCLTSRYARAGGEKCDCRNRLPPWWERAHRGVARKCIAMRQVKTANNVLVMVVLRRKILAGSVFIVVKFCDCGYVSGVHWCAASVRQRRYLFLIDALHHLGCGRSQNCY